MTITGAIVVFVITWWLSFFVVLPIGVRGQFEEGEQMVPGTEEAAPVDPMIRKKMLWATYGALGLTLLIGISTYVLDFHELFLAR